MRHEWKAEQETMVSRYSDAMDKIWKDINSTLCEYLSLTTARRHHYIELRHLDDRNTAERLHNEKLIGKYTKLLDKLKNDYKVLVEDTEFQIKHLTELKQKLSKRCLELKQDLTQSIKKDEKQLKILTFHSNAVIKELQNIYSLYENIQKVFRCCERLETETDKLIIKEKMQQNLQKSKAEQIQETDKQEAEETSTGSSSTSEDNEKIIAVRTASSMENQPSLTPLLKRLNKMDMICFRFKKAEVDRLLLKKEKEKLILENQNLKQIIKGILRDAGSAPPTPPQTKSKSAPTLVLKNDLQVHAFNCVILN